MTYAHAACDKDSFPNIHCLLIIAYTLPITSADAERPFSLPRMLKTYLDQQRLMTVYLSLSLLSSLSSSLFTTVKELQLMKSVRHL